MKRLWIACTMVLALGAIGCGGGGDGGGDTDAHEASAEYAGAIASSDVARGQEVYGATCDACHSSGPALENIGWDPARLRQQVREGSGRMPAISESRVSADDLEAILAYMVTTGGVIDEGGAPATGGGEEPAAAEEPTPETTDAPADETATDA